MAHSQNLKLNGEKEEKSKRNGFNWFLYFSGSTATLLFVTIGSTFVWTSPVIPKLLSNNTAINPLGTPITTTQISLLASLPKVSGLVSLILVPNVADRIGRKKTLIFIGSGLVLSLVLVAFATHIYVYLASVLLKGLSLSGSMALVPVYVNEIAENANRGRMGCVLSVGIPTGIVLSYIYGSFTSIRMYSLLIAVPATLYLIFSYFTPETPIFFALRKRKIEGLEALGKLRNFTKATDVEVEYDKLEQMIEENRKAKMNGIVQLFTDRAARKACLITVVIFAVQQFCGNAVILAFLAPIFNQAGSKLSGNSVGIIAGLVQMLSFSFSIVIVDKFGRRPLILYSTLACGFPTFVLGLYFYLKSINSNVIENITWSPIVCIVLFIIVYSLGLGSIPYCLIGELFSNELRAVGGATMLIIDNFVIFFLNFTFPFASQNLGVHWCLWFFSFVSFLGFGAMYFILPETKGKSLAEIQKMLKR